MTMCTVLRGIFVGTVVATLQINCLAASDPADGAIFRPQLVAAETAQYCYQKNKEGKEVLSGFACDILNELARRVGVVAKPELYPVARALRMAASNPNVLVTPVSRLAARENLFSWQIKICQESFVVVTRRDSPVDISSLESIKHLNVGLVREGAGIHLANKYGLVHTSSVPTDEVNAMKLHLGRIDAWLGAWNSIRAGQRLAGLDMEQLRRGVVLERLPVYIAGSPDLPATAMVQWKAAFNSMVADGSYARLQRENEMEFPR